MNFKKLWEKLSGKKFNTGSVIMFAAIFLHEVVGGIWGFDPWWLAKVVSTLNWVGGLTAGVGAAHKFQKGEWKLKNQNGDA